MASTDVDLLDGIWFEQQKTISSPVNGYYRLLITNDKIKLITECHDLEESEGIESQEEIIISHGDFEGKTDFHDKIKEIFGEDILDHVIHLLSGKIDYLQQLPDKVLQTVIANLPLSDIMEVSLVNKRFRKICQSEGLWEIKFREQYGVDCLNDMTPVSKVIGWYKIFVETYKVTKSCDDYFVKEIQETIKQKLLALETAESLQNISISEDRKPLKLQDLFRFKKL